MGLWTSHNCWDGSYGGFAEFREAVGRAAGLPYRLDKRPVGGIGHTLDIDWERVTDEQIMGEWGDVKPTWQVPDDIYGIPIHDPVLYLLIHSDCDGVLKVDYLPELKARLERLEPVYIARTSDDTYLQGSLRKFIDGLESAINYEEDVVFS